MEATITAIKKPIGYRIILSLPTEWCSLFDPSDQQRVGGYLLSDEWGVSNSPWSRFISEWQETESLTQKTIESLQNEVKRAKQHIQQQAYKTVVFSLGRRNRDHN